jgi:hypothetical protein
VKKIATSPPNKAKEKNSIANLEDEIRTDERVNREAKYACKQGLLVLEEPIGEERSPARKNFGMRVALVGVEVGAVVIEVIAAGLSDKKPKRDKRESKCIKIALMKGDCACNYRRNNRRAKQQDFYDANCTLSFRGSAIGAGAGGALTAESLKGIEGGKDVRLSKTVSVVFRDTDILAQT